MAQDEKTLPQRAAGVAVIQGGKLTKIVSVATYKTYRAMRKDPTICMARQLLMAPILASAWSIQEKEDAPEGARDFIDDQMSAVRLHLLGTAMRGCLDFGWQAYEKVFGVDQDGRIVIKKLKPLIQDFTDIIVDQYTGAFAGLKQNLIDLEAPECLLLYIDAEGTDWYGQSVMENARLTYNMWNETNLGAERYDQKIAGSHWVIHYPEGPSLVDGKEVDNLQVAKDVISTLESSGAVVVPRRSGDTSDDFG
ncbi:MAG: hypothetical protein QGD91_12400, partial [Actinomycetota bacterium]|nr:hypothetical protein [Actinomycetota bacterium]